MSFRHDFVVSLSQKSQNRDMACRGILAQLSNQVAKIFLSRCQIRQNYQRPLLFGFGHQGFGRTDDRDTIPEIMEAIDQLGTNEKVLIHNKGERLGHLLEIERHTGKLQKYSTIYLIFDLIEA